jgi:hypothetical protein
VKTTRAGARNRARHTDGKSPRSTSARATAPRNTTGRRRASAVEQPSGQRASGRPDQFGAIFAKGLDLAEASLSLGLTMINRVGAAAQNQMERMMSAMPQEGAIHDPATHAHAPHPTAAAVPQAMGGPGMSAAPASEEPQYAITNRIPVAPGGSVRIPFSINNDSVSSPKTVMLKAVGFTGEIEGTQLDATQFVVKPSRRRIAPMDFEKFVLEGTIPADLPSDVYHGAIVILSGQELSIPVRLVVQAI